MSDMLLMCFHNNENIFAAHDALPSGLQNHASEEEWKKFTTPNTTPVGDIRNIKFVWKSSPRNETQKMI